MDLLDQFCMFGVYPGILMAFLLSIFISRIKLYNKINLVMYLIFILIISVIITIVLNPVLIFTAGIVILVFVFISNTGASKDFAPVEWITRGYVKPLEKTEEEHEYVISNTQLYFFTMLVMLASCLVMVMLYSYWIDIF